MPNIIEMVMFRMCYVFTHCPLIIKKTTTELKQSLTGKNIIHNNKRLIESL